MRHKTLFYIILSCLLLLAAQSRIARAGSAENWVKKGNQAYETKKYDEALKDYDKAGVDVPESALIDFNKGAAFYRKGDWDKAKESWNNAAQKAKSPLFTARALYNLGNCEYKVAMRQKDSDMNKAVEACTQSIQNYQKALDQLSSMAKDPDEGEIDPGLKRDATKNIETVRLVMKSMMDEITRKKAEAKKAAASANSLKKLIDRQKELIDRNKYFADEKKDNLKKDKEISGLADDQKALAKDTDKAAEAMSKKGGKNAAPPPGNPPGTPNGSTGPMAAAKGLLKNAVKNQTSAAKKIGDKKLPDAETDQAAALADMEKALKSLTKQGKSGKSKSENKQKQGQDKAGKKDKQKDQAAKKLKAKKENKQQNGQDNTAGKIIDSERERRNNANHSTSGGYSDVDKNW
ncbi:MAG: tetratricopeptide repeat protein [Deltaproteobacteria bacterium]|nr:tetratricopeptide repeat protein [Deltaproteobacteria bacterium]